MNRVLMTDDTMRVVVNALEAVPMTRTRDSLIAHQVAGVLKRALMPDAPAPMRWADEPLPIVTVIPEAKKKGAILYKMKDGEIREITEIRSSWQIIRVNDEGIWEEA